MEGSEEIIADSEGEETNLLENQLGAQWPPADLNPSNAVFKPNTSTNSGPTTSNIAERAKLRSRNSKPVVSPRDFIELTSDDDDDLPHRNKKKREKVPSRSRPQKTSTEANVTPDPRLKPRPRPRPILTAKPNDVAVHQVMPSVIALYQRETPIPSSLSVPDHGVIPFRLLPSQPSTSEIPSSTGDPYDLPPIVTLQNPETDVPSPYPSSLFSAASPRKRRRLRVTSPIDDLDPVQQPACGSGIPPSAPPPTFFAGSSSPPTELMIAESALAAQACPKEDPPVPGRMRKKGPEAGGKPRLGKKLTQRQKTVQNRAEVVIALAAKDKRKSEANEKRVDIEAALTKEIVRRRRSDSMMSLSSLSSDFEAIPVAATSRSEIGQVIDIDVQTKSLKHKSGKISQAKRRVKIQGSTAKTENKSRTESSVVQATLEERPSEEGKTSEEGAVAMPDERERGHLEECAIKERAVPGPPALTVKPSTLSTNCAVAPKIKPTPMSELIRRVNSLPGSPFQSPAPRLSISSTAYSPYLKSSRSALSRIAPLHPHRRTPPPPLPPVPPRKKTKKELEMEERWEEELVESVGTTEWACLTDAERAELRRAKREKEMAGWDD